jgi:hypothetical protein
MPLETARRSNRVYVCGTPLFPAEHYVPESMYCSHALSWRAPVERALYGIIGSTLRKATVNVDPTFCSVCGKQHVADEQLQAGLPSSAVHVHQYAACAQRSSTLQLLLRERR